MRRISRAWFGGGSRGVDVAGPAILNDEEPKENSRPTGDPSSAAHAGILEDLRKCIVESSEGKLSAYEVDARARLYDHGYVDSLSTASLLAFIHQRYDVEISEVDLVGRLSSLDALARHILAVARVPN